MSARSGLYAIAVGRVTAEGSPERRMRGVVDALWDALSAAGVSWVGFYTVKEGALVLGPCRDSPACSPIGMHGVCGQAIATAAPRVVRDVAELEGAYVACDPRDRSELVVPLLDERGAAWAVLDLDSWSVGAFDDADAAGLARVLEAAGFTPAIGTGRA